MKMIKLTLLLCGIALAASAQDNMLIGAGTPTVYPLFAKMFLKYKAAMTSYQSIGSDKGLAELTDREVDFAAADAPFNQEQTKKLHTLVLQIPVTAGVAGKPAAGFTRIVIYKEQNYDGRSKDHATQLVKLLWYIIHKGQANCAPLNYAPLSKPAVAAAEALLHAVTYNGERLAIGD